MSRKRMNIAPQASLFPFLSILACIIGVLALMIGMLAPGQAKVRQEIRDPAVAQELADLNEQINNAQVDIDRLNKRRNQAEELHSQLERAENELRVLQTERAAVEQKVNAALQERASLERDLKTFETQATTLNVALPELEKKVTSDELELIERGKPAPPAVTEVNGYSSRKNIEPVFVECRADGISILEGEQPIKVGSTELNSKPEFIALLDRVAKNPKGAVIFLVHKDAVATYLAARDAARKRACRNGKIPIVSDGPVDVSQAIKQMTKEE